MQGKPDAITFPMFALLVPSPHATVVECFVMDDLAHEKLGPVLHWDRHSRVRLEKLKATRLDPVMAHC